MIVLHHSRIIPSNQVMVLLRTAPKPVLATDGHHNQYSLHQSRKCFLYGLMNRGHSLSLNCCMRVKRVWLELVEYIRCVHNPFVRSIYLLRIFIACFRLISVLHLHSSASWYHRYCKFNLCTHTQPKTLLKVPLHELSLPHIARICRCSHQCSSERSRFPCRR